MTQRHRRQRRDRNKRPKMAQTLRDPGPDSGGETDDDGSFLAANGDGGLLAAVWEPELPITCWDGY